MGEGTGNEIVPAIPGSSNEVAFEELGVAEQVFSRAEGEVVRIGVFGVVDAAEELIDCAQAVHSANYINIWLANERNETLQILQTLQTFSVHAGGRWSNFVIRMSIR
jgi:hypothetical protein